MNYKTRTKTLPPRLVLLLVFALSFILSSCNVTRTVSTTAQYYQRGDTTCTVVTKTIESYDATKKLNY